MRGIRLFSRCHVKSAEDPEFSRDLVSRRVAMMSSELEVLSNKVNFDLVNLIGAVPTQEHRTESHPPFKLNGVAKPFFCSSQ